MVYVSLPLTPLVLYLIDLALRAVPELPSHVMKLVIKALSANLIISVHAIHLQMKKSQLSIYTITAVLSVFPPLCVFDICCGL